MIADS